MTYKHSRFTHPAGGAPIVIMGEYRPWHVHKAAGGTSGNWDEHSSRIMDVKQRRPVGYEYFANGLLGMINTYRVEAVTVVPGHNPDSAPSGLLALVEKIVPRARVTVGSDYLKRVALIEKLASGGDRSMEIHLKSIIAHDPARYRGKSILLVDDVLTSGNSMAACRKILQDAGARVHALALSQTTY